MKMKSIESEMNNLKIKKKQQIKELSTFNCS